MVFRLHSLLIVIFVTAVRTAIAAPQTADVIQLFPLDDHRVYEIAIGQEVPTTLMFPSALTAIEGANVSTHAETPAPVILAYAAGRNFLTVRAVEPNATAAVNVIWKNKTFVIRFISKGAPCSSVTFYEEPAPLTVGRSTSPTKLPDAKTLLNLLEEARSYAVLRVFNPEAAARLERTTPRTVTSYADFHVRIEEVFRFDSQDTLVFQLSFENTSDKKIFYDAQQLAVRIGSHLYPASVADASGSIPAQSSTTAYLGITGDGQGGRADLSLKNTFSIVVSRREEKEQGESPR